MYDETKLPTNIMNKTLEALAPYILNAFISSPGFLIQLRHAMYEKSEDKIHAIKAQMD